KAILQQIELNESENRETKLNIKEFSDYLKIILSQIDSNKELMNIKIKEPSREIEIISLKEQFISIQNLIDKANENIKIHNNTVLNYTKENEKKKKKNKTILN